MNIQDLLGNWKAGWALDLHTESSIMNPDGSFDTRRTNIGEALYKFKYCNDYYQLEYLAQEVIQFLKTRMVTPYISVIFPVPASKQRNFQPVYELAIKVGEYFKIPVDFDFIQKIKQTDQLKSIDDPLQRKSILQGSFQVANNDTYSNKKVLIIDDLFRSGATLYEITDVLYKQARVQNVYVVTLTKTRVKR